MRQLGVLLVGGTGAGTEDSRPARYEAAFAAHPGFRVVGHCGNVDGYAEVLRGDQVDVVGVCLPIQDRVGAMTAALAAGRHVLVDGPLAETGAWAAAIAAVADHAGSVFLPAHHHRFHPSLRSVRSAVASGRIGLPWNVQVDFVVAGGDSTPGLIDLGMYPIDVVLAVTGLAVRRVYAIGGDDLAVLHLDHERGLTSTVSVGRIGTLAGVRPGRLALHRYRVSGSHGMLLSDATSPAVTVQAADGRRTSWLDEAPALAGLLDELYATVTTGRRAELGPEDVMAALRILTAARESVRTGMPVSIHTEESG